MSPRSHTGRSRNRRQDDGTRYTETEDSTKQVNARGREAIRFPAPVTDRSNEDRSNGRSRWCGGSALVLGQDVGLRNATVMRADAAGGAGRDLLLRLRRVRGRVCHGCVAVVAADLVVELLDTRFSAGGHSIPLDS